MSEYESATGFLAPKPEDLAPFFPAYQIHSLIAVGGMGAVYHALQISLDREVAIKILPAEFSSDESFCQSFEAEAKAMAKLNHPNLIGVFDFGEFNGMLFIVMEYVPGLSLHDAMHGAALDPAEVTRLIKQTALGLAHAHDHGILHRDIKPANILLDQHGQPKIGDFGLARPVDLKIQEGEIIYGTPGYTAPEVLAPPHHADQRADIFSLGVMLHELLTGKLPEADHRPPSAICHCDVRLDAVVRKATQPRPELRYQSATQLAHDLEQIEHGPAARPAQATRSVHAAGPSARKRPPVRPVVPPRTSRPAATSHNGLGVMLLGLAVAYGLYHFRDRLIELIHAPPKEKIQQVAPLLTDPRNQPAIEEDPGGALPSLPKEETGHAYRKPRKAAPKPESGLPKPSATFNKPEEPASSGESIIPQQSAPTVAKLDVSEFLKTVQGVMIRKSAFDISRRDDALEKNMAEFRKEGKKLIRKYFEKYQKDRAERDFDIFVERQVERGNRVGDELPEKFEDRLGFHPLLVDFQKNEAKIDADLVSALSDEGQTYVQGLEAKVKKLREENDPVAAEQIQEEIDRVKRDPQYFVEMMVSGNK